MCFRTPIDREKLGDETGSTWQFHANVTVIRRNLPLGCPSGLRRDQFGSQFENRQRPPSKVPPNSLTRQPCRIRSWDRTLDDPLRVRAHNASPQPPRAPGGCPPATGPHRQDRIPQQRSLQGLVTASPTSSQARSPGRAVYFLGSIARMVPGFDPCPHYVVGHPCCVRSSMVR